MKNMKDILTLQLNTLPLDSGTTMFEEVEAIAYSCPYTEGKAVYYARAMLISRYGYIEFDDDVLCTTGDETSHFRRANPNGTQEKTEIEIVPNPVINSFAVQNNADKLIHDIEIFDIIGRCILTTQNESVDFSKYSSGRYFIKVQFTDQSKQVKLFIKE
jgi:hypothetical protein